ncbi:sensor histidine kinase [Metabacillus litoralis]|uniref:histidine kinase n=1 Tax=Metabacillus litoralis TaxID=152268 RepID=A0A5C6VYD1_9BACI|nr:sensor histidine kinase [Metabacillus litoralis]TXC90561.1 sensor histidine kinase [Metabacillus litoralis]
MKQPLFQFNHLPIRHKIITLLLLISILPSIGLGLLTGYTVEHIIDKQATQHTLQLIEQVNRTLESHASNMQNITYLLSMDPEIKKFLSNQEIEDQNENEEYEIRQFMQGLSTLYPEVAGILVVNSNGGYVSNELYPRFEYNLTNEAWYKEAVENEGIFKIIGHPTDRKITSHVKYKNSEVVTVVRAILQPETQKVLGVVLIDLKLRVIAEATKNVRLGKYGYLMVIDEKGQGIYTPPTPLIENVPERLLINEEDSGSFSEKINGNNLQFIFQKQAFTNWITVGIFSMNDSVVEVRKIHLFVISFFFFVCLFGITASYYISKSMSEPIVHLMSIMRQVESGTLTVRYEGNRKDEIGMLGKSFNHMISKIINLLSLTEHHERQKREAELRSLQAHIKPHFLYNTLDTINWMARNQGAEDVSELVSSLSRLFRIGLNKGQDHILLTDEITHIQSYLSIQKARYRDKLNFTITIEPAIHDVMTLKLVLQPIVENAIYHGIKERRGPGHIYIQANKEQDFLVLTVRDDGKGIDQDRLGKLRKTMDALYDNKESKQIDIGYGMMNVQERIKLTYGNNYGIKIDSKVGEGTIVTIFLPIKRDIIVDDAKA